MILKITIILFLIKNIVDDFFIKYFVWSIFLIIIFILIAELFSRYYLGLGNPPLSVLHPTIEYICKPNQDVYRFGNHFITNQYGMRSEPFSKKKNNNELRIMFFGDSVVNGGNLIDQDELATRILKNKLSEIVDKDVIIGNISAGSWGPGNWLAYAEEYGFFDADIVVLIISSHDYADNPTFQPLDKNTHPTKKPILAFIEGIERYLPRYLPQISIDSSVTENDQDIPEEHEIEKGLYDLKSFLKLAKIYSNNILVFQHYEKSEIESNNVKPGNKYIKEISQQVGIIPISLEPYFRSSIDRGINPYSDNIHPNNVGQKLIAEAVFTKINILMNSIPVN